MSAARVVQNRRLRNASAEPTQTMREIATRFVLCHLLLNEVEGQKVSLEELGLRLSRHLPYRDSPMRKDMVYRMESGERPIRIEDIEAMVTVCSESGLNIDPGWIAFGDLTEAPSPPKDRLRAAKLTRR